MVITELIDKLSTLKNVYGDIEVYISTKYFDSKILNISFDDTHSEVGTWKPIPMIDIFVSSPTKVEIYEFMLDHFKRENKS